MIGKCWTLTDRIEPLEDDPDLSDEDLKALKAGEKIFYQVCFPRVLTAHCLNIVIGLILGWRTYMARGHGEAKGQSKYLRPKPKLPSPI